MASRSHKEAVMRLVIFGATGRIGRHLLSWAVDAGHDVHVLARSPKALRPRDGLTVNGGDVLDPARPTSGLPAVGREVLVPNDVHHAGWSAVGPVTSWRSPRWGSRRAGPSPRPLSTCRGRKAARIG